MIDFKFGVNRVVYFLNFQKMMFLQFFPGGALWYRNFVIELIYTVFVRRLSLYLSNSFINFCNTELIEWFVHEAHAAILNDTKQKVI